MKIISADITGSLIINNQDVTTTVESSSIWSGSIASRVTDLEQFSSSLDATFATDQQLNQATASLSGSIALLSSSYLATSQSYDIVSSSYSAASGSFSTRVTTLEAASSSLNTASGSFSTRVTNNEATGSSLTTASGSFSTRVTTIESKYATTGSNTYTGPQYINEGSNAISFTSTASLYTDGGLRVTKDAFVSGTMYLNNLTVYGTSSIQYATSSQLNVGTNIISVNTNTPTLRFGGLAVYDSGSTGLTGSMLWDSEDNQWIYSNPSGSTYDSAVFLVGPRNSGVIGNEPGITCNFLSKGNGMHHMTSSAIFDDGSRTCFYGSSIITSTGVGCFSGTVCAASVASTGTITGTTSYASTVACSPVVCAGTSCATSFVGGTVSGTTISGTTLYGSTAVCAPTVFGTTRVCSANLCATTTICGPAFIGGTVSGTTGTFSSCVAGTQLYADSSTNSIIQSTINTNADCCAIISARWSAGTGIRMYYHPNSAVSVIENTYQSAAGQVFGDILFRHNVGGTQTTRLRLQADGGIACFSGTVCAPTFVGALSGNASTSTTFTGAATLSGALSIGSSVKVDHWNDGGGNYMEFTGNTNATRRLRIQGPNSSMAYTQFFIDAVDQSITFATSGVNRFYVGSAGTLTVSGDVIAYGSPSDISLNMNVKPIENALDKVMKLKGVSFTWKEDTSASCMTNIKDDIGFIAQEVKEVIPELVRKNDNCLLSLRDKGIIPILVEAIKEQQCQIEYLKSKIG